LKTTGINGSLWVGYEAFENLFVDATMQYRRLSVPDRSSMSSSNWMLMLGLRMNMFRRQYDY
jgi:hypothetical protein